MRHRADESVLLHTPDTVIPTAQHQQVDKKRVTASPVAD